MKQTKSRALSIVQSYFPKTKFVKDATKPLQLEVTNADSMSPDVKTHRSCALAVCAKRTTNADGVIVSRGVTYIVKGNTGYRYRNGEAITREIVAFDRRAGFAPGKYLLKPIPECRALGVPRVRGPHKEKGSSNKFMHITTGVRTIMGHKEEVV